MNWHLDYPGGSTNTQGVARVEITKEGRTVSAGACGLQRLGGPGNFQVPQALDVVWVDRGDGGGVSVGARGGEVEIGGAHGGRR
jgi:hypothetical protein